MPLNKPGYLFIVKIVAVYMLWKVFHYYAHLPGSLVFVEWSKWIDQLNIFYANTSNGVLQLFGENTRLEHNGIRALTTGRVVFVEEHCLAIPAMLIFSSSILLYKGNWLNKLWFIPLGLVVIFFINALRIVLVYYLFNYTSHLFFSINHSYVYVFITYAVIFALIVWWMKKHPGK